MSTEATETEVGYAVMEDEPDEPARPDSLLERLREDRRALASAESTTIEIPGYDGELVCRYRLMEASELEKIARKAAKLPRERRNLAVTMDSLSASCIEFETVDHRNGGAAGTLAENGGDPIRYDDRLAEALGYTAKSAREAVLGLFGGNEIAVLTHGAQLARWWSDASEDVDEDFLGN